MRTNPSPALEPADDPFRTLVLQLAAGVARCRASLDGTEVTDLEVVEINPAFRDLTSSAIVVGLRFLELARGRALDSQSILARATRVLASGQPERAELRFGTRWLISTTYRLAADEVAIVLDDASRSKLAEEAGARSETRFAAAFRANAAALAISRCSDLRVIDVNEQLLALIGMPRDQVIGRTPAELGLTPASYVQGRVEELARPGAGHARQHEVVITPPSGETRILLASAQVIEVDDEPCALTTFLDITERTRGAQRLAAQHAIHRALSDAPDLASVAPRIAEALCRADDWDFGAIWLVGSDGKLRSCGSWHRPELDAGALVEATRTVAMGPGEGMLGRVLASRTAEVAEVSAATFLRAAPALACGLRYTIAFPIVLGDETIGVVDLLAREHGELTAPLRDLFGAVGTTLAVFVERARALAELRASEDRLRAVVEALNEGLVIADSSARGTYVNAAARRMHGLPETGAGGLPSSAALFEATTLTGEAVAPEDFPMRRVLRGEPLRGLELRVTSRHTGQARVLAFSGALVSRADGHNLGVLSISDITERVEALRALRELNAELERRVGARTEALTASNRELEAFAHSVSHDLRTPLRAINAFIAIVLDEHAASLGPEVVALLGRVRDSGRRMTAMIADLLALAQVGNAALVRSVIDVGALVAEVADEVRRARVDGGRVEVRIAALPPCEADRALLRQVWMNLIDNAFKYAGKRPAPVVELGAERCGEQVVYTVRDNGVGFDPAHAARLFRAFQRLHRASDFEGTGLGLANVRRIIERHGGRVWAESIPDRGATFRFTLGKDFHDG